jgi:signal transduction histidine kinase
MSDQRRALANDPAEAAAPLPHKEDGLGMTDTRTLTPPAQGTASDTAEAAAEALANLAAENERLRTLVKLQSELVSNVAHDLRTPLTSVLGFTELLLKRELPPTERERYLRIVNGEMRRFASLIDELYDAQLIAKGRSVLSIDRFDLGALLRQQVDLFGAQSDRHPLRLELPAQRLVVSADKERVARVIANLLSNAIKYSPGGGEITITAESDHGLVRVSVSDHGVGIAAEQQHRVFAKFFRADASSNGGIKGAGLGLALCREIVQAHGGALGFDSAYGKGSTFWFELRPEGTTMNGHH